MQNATRAMLQARLEPYDGECRLRKKIQRWKLDDPPALVAARLENNLKIIGARCRPCVVAAFFRTLWNGWPTSARMRNMAGACSTGRCVLGCSNTAEDRIEHYVVCPKAWNVFSNPPPYGLGLDKQRRSRQAMLLAAKGLSDDEKVLVAIAVYALARTVQCLQAAPHLQHPERLIRLYIQ